jgi:uncharacterized protein (DUF1684 family)
MAGIGSENPGFVAHDVVLAPIKRSDALRCNIFPEQRLSRAHRRADYAATAFQHPTEPMKLSTLALSALLLTSATAATPSIEDRWKASILEGNRDWAKTSHAILKIQDAAYLGEGQSATLIGTKGKPDSYKWISGKHTGVMTAEYHGGKVVIALSGGAVPDASKSIPVDAKVDVQAYPTQVSAGVMGVRVLVYNQLRADALNFKGVDFFPYDPAYRVSATFKPDAKLPPRVFRTSRGTDKQFFHAGDATFKLKGKTFTLPFYADGNDRKKITDMSAFFVDNLTGKGTYGAGRYVDIADFGAFPPKTATIVYNDAYNPNCARSAFFTCPVATDSIAMSVQAGERDPHAKH